MIALRVVATITGLCASLLWAAAHAQDGTGDAKGLLEQLDLSTPETPAFTVLNVSPQTITRPSSPSEFAASLLQGVDANGNFQSGLALNTTPYMLFFGNDVTQQRLKISFLERAASRLQLSLATTKGVTEDDESARGAIGLRWTIFDFGDPRTFEDDTKDEGDPGRSLLECFIARDDAFRDAEFPEGGFANEADFAKKIKDDPARQRELEGCRESFRERLWYRSAMDFAVAQAFISEDGGTDGFDTSGLLVSSSLAYGFEGLDGLEGKAQIVIHGRYTMDDVVADKGSPSGFIEQDSFLAGLRLYLGDPNSLQFSVEGAYEYSDRDGRDNDDALRYAVGTDIKLDDQLWLGVSLGGSSGRDSGDGDQLFALGQLRWAFGEKASIERLDRRIGASQ